MNKILQKAFAVFCFCILVNSLPCMAGIEPYEQNIKGQIRKDSTFTVKDEKFRNPNFNWADITNISVKNNITLRILDNLPISKSFSCKAVLRVEYFTDPSQVIPHEIETVTLNVNYSKEKSTYKITDNYWFKDAHQVKIYVKEISSPEFGLEIPPVLQLSSSIVVDRQYMFKPASPLSAWVSKTAAGLQFIWDPITGAEEYDIEWTTVDSISEHSAFVQQQMMTATSGLPIWQLGSLFKNNATRITTQSNDYLLSLAYNSKYVVCRIRQVQYQNGIRLEGDWQYQTKSGAYMASEIQWHESNKNWQYSAVFAEDGKKKETISYFDGSLRSRQTATINNSDNVAVVQENVYDNFGRQAASILPAPAKQGSGTQFLHYFKNFNLDSLGRPYSFSALNTAACEITPMKLSTDSGASRYYSSKNPFINDKKYNAYIPDAAGYPISLTQYTADNTGRIKIQGGVGEMFQPGIGFPSKTTKYYYGSPQQVELDRLFGNDVGVSNRYLKNMVVDPNGQISVSYLNSSGKTIATTLTGAAPPNVDALKSSLDKKLRTSAILLPEQFVYNSTALALTAKTTYLASVTGAATINYDIQKLINKRVVGKGNSAFEVCSNCYYDLTIKIFDDCNNRIDSLTGPIKIGADVADCDNLGLQSGKLDINFPQVGEYNISFEFAFNREIIQKYTAEYIKKGQEHLTVKKEFDFVRVYLDSLDLNGLFSDCRNCEQTLGTKSLFTKKIKSTVLALEVDSSSVNNDDFIAWAGTKYEDILANCKRLQDSCLLNSNPCERYERLMSMDVAPGGQFAMFDEDGTPLEAQLNILAQYWKSEFPDSAPESALYQSDLITLEDGTVTSPYAADFEIPEVLKFWKEEWALKFLKYHPEFCKLQFCRTNTAYFSWDERVKDQITESSEIHLIERGSNLKYQNSNATWLLAADPFFKNGPGKDFLTAMQDDLQSYSQNVLAISSPDAQVKSLTGFVDYMLYCGNPKGTANTTPTANSWNTCKPDDNCRVADREWTYYRDSYFELKEKYYKAVRENGICKDACVTGTPLTLVAPAVLTTHDFVIRSEEDNSGCTATQRRLSVNYKPGAVTVEAVTVEIYIPGKETLVLEFKKGESSKGFCIPRGYPRAIIKVSSVKQ